VKQKIVNNRTYSKNLLTIFGRREISGKEGIMKK
jgi:hypothetical protein